MTTNNEQKQTFPPQHQNNQPGIETQMTPQPQFEDSNYRPAGKLKGKVALITGGAAESGVRLPWHTPKKGRTWPSFT